MEKRRVAVLVTLLAGMVLLSAMGCWFCWHCPSRVFGEHGLFGRQLAWNGVGFSAFAVALCIGWRRLLKAAPWLMAAWLVAFVAARFSVPVRGAHRWLPIGPFRVNVVTCFMPIFALFVAWLHEKRRVRPCMEWAALAGAALCAAGMVLGSAGLMERLDAFVRPEAWIDGRAYMARQLVAALAEARWFGGAGRDLGFLPCPDSEGMVSASALLFGKWFPAAVMALFALVGSCMTLIWRGFADASRRRYVLLFGLWLIAPAAYCLLHSLALLPVAGISPALASCGGSTAVMAWFGTGALTAMVWEGLSERGQDVGEGAVGLAWGGLAAFVVAAIAFAPGRERWTPRGRGGFAEPRPSDLTFGEFGLVPKRGRILAADGSTLAYTVRAWRYYLDPRAAGGSCRMAEVAGESAKGLDIPPAVLHEAYAGAKSQDEPARRHIFLKEAADDSPAAKFFEARRDWLTKMAGVIREPVQRRVYPLGAAASSVVGFMHGSMYGEAPKGAGGLEWAFDRELAGRNGVYDRKLPLKERKAKATPVSGADVRTTLVPEVQKTVADALAAACATNGAESAWGMVMKVPGGEIAAMASLPTFDPSMRRELDKWDPSMSVNRAAKTLFEPGCLVRPVTMTVAIDEGLLGGDGEGDAVCQVLPRIGPEKFHAALLRFGFGAKTGAAGIPGEETGILASGPGRWDKTTAGCVERGHGFAVTGLQIAQAYATIANNGTLVRPVLVKAAATNVAANVVSPAAACAAVCLLNPPMAAKVAMVEGKAYSPTNHIVSCVGLHPADGRPQYVVAVSFVKPKGCHDVDSAALPAWTRIAECLAPGVRRQAD